MAAGSPRLRAYRGYACLEKILALRSVGFSRAVGLRRQTEEGAPAHQSWLLVVDVFIARERERERRLLQDYIFHPESRDGGTARR